MNFKQTLSIPHEMKLRKVKNKLEKTVVGIVILLRARWHKYGEKSSNYFLNFEARHNL